MILGKWDELRKRGIQHETSEIELGLSRTSNKALKGSDNEILEFEKKPGKRRCDIWLTEKPPTTIETYEEVHKKKDGCLSGVIESVFELWRNFDTKNTLDPYVVLRMGKHKFQTKPVINSSEHMRFHGYIYSAPRDSFLQAEGAGEQIKFTVLDSDLGIDRVLGFVTVSLDTIPRNDVRYYRVSEMQDLEKKFSGVIIYSIIMDDSTVTVTLHRVEFLQEAIVWNPEDTGSVTWQGFLIFWIWCLLSAAVMSWIEGWDYNESVYFTIVTIAAVGYGDYYPTSDIGMLVNTFLIITYIALLGWVVSVVANYVLMHAMRSNSGGGRMSTKSSVRRICILAGMIFLFIGINVLIMMIEEDWSFIRSLHFSVVTLSTVGYGDISPTKEKSRAWICVYILIIITMVAKLMNMSMDTAMAVVRREKLGKAIESNLRLVEILDADGDGRISEFEYLSRMLVFTRLVNKTELEALMKGFYDVDTDRNGYVDVQEIQRKYNVRGSTFYFGDEAFADLEETLTSAGHETGAESAKLREQLLKE